MIMHEFDASKLAYSRKPPEYFPRISSPFFFFCFFGVPLFSTKRANMVFFVAGVLIPA